MTSPSETPEKDTLVVRLREEQEAVIRYRQSLGAEGDYLFQEAADRIESLERRLREAENFIKRLGLQAAFEGPHKDPVAWQQQRAAERGEHLPESRHYEPVTPSSDQAFQGWNAPPEGSTKTPEPSGGRRVNES